MKPRITIRLLFAIVVQFVLASITTIGGTAEIPATTQPSAASQRLGTNQSDGNTPSKMSGEVDKIEKGRDATTGSVQTLLAQAVAANSRTVRIPPGVYRLAPEADGKAHLHLHAVKDLEILADGVELVSTSALTVPAVLLEDCSGVTIRGLTLDCDPLVFTQGRVTAFEPKRSWIEVTIDRGFPRQPEDLAARKGERPVWRPMSILDPTTKLWKLGAPDVQIERVEANDGVWRVFTPTSSQGAWPLAAGDLAVIPVFGSPAFTSRRSNDLTFEDCTVYQSGNMAFHEDGGGGNTVLRRCRVLRRPQTPRLISSNADGFHCANMRRGPTLDHCLFDGMHDDGINIYGSYARVVEAPQGNMVLVTPRWAGTVQVGDHVEFFSHHDGRSCGVFTTRAVEPLVDGLKDDRWTMYHSKAGKLVRLTLDRSPSIEDLDGLMNLDACGANFTVRDSECRNLRYRGILVRTHHGLIEGNLLTGLGNDGISLTAHPFGEGPYSQDIIIRHNRIRQIGMLPYGGLGGIGVGIRVGVSPDMRWDGPPGSLSARTQQRIVIEDNDIADTTGDGIQIANAQEVMLRRNRIEGVAVRRHQAFDRWHPIPIRVVNAEAVAQEQNQVIGAASE